MQSLQHDQGPAGDPRIDRAMTRPDRQPAAAARHLPGLPGADRPQPARGPRADDGALGHALARLRAEGQENRSGRHQCPQRQVAALAALARRREPLRRALHELLRERDAAGRLAARRSGSPSTRRRPLAFFAGIWTRWTSVRKVKEGETTNDLFAFLTTEPNSEVGAIHPKAMPVILTTPEEIETSG